jgi:predicted RND superfamily exporter protein
MRAWLKKHFPAIDENVDRIGYWAGFIALVWTAMSAIVSSIPSISQYGWGAVVLAGLGVACIFALVTSACLVAWRYFIPTALIIDCCP